MKVGLVGQRGMVGSVLIERMKAEGDFSKITPFYFSTSQVGEAVPSHLPKAQGTFLGAENIDALSQMDVILTCQGGDYSKAVYPVLRQSGWKGYWIDAASALRMDDDAVLALDPVNLEVIEAAIAKGVRTFVGANCTVSLMLMGFAGLFKAGVIDWVSSMTYQAASGAGAQQMKELLAQMAHITHKTESEINSLSALELEALVGASMKSANFPKELFGAPLAANLIPWIDTGLENGQTREEWKGMVEANKILGLTKNPIAIDGLCVRVGAMRCHSQAVLFKLKKDIPMQEIEVLIREANPWVKFVANTKEETLKKLTPEAVSGTLDIAVGRLRKTTLGPEYLTGFTCGDQLLWGAAEPLRRLLGIINK
jgi:aspartate-semialdehyde dehydrogenase